MPRPDTVLCFPNLDGALSNLFTTRGQTVPNAGALGFPSFLGEIDRTWTTTNSFGGSVQAASSEKLFGHENNFTIGLSVDRGLVQFSTTGELGTVNANQFPTLQGVTPLTLSTSPRVCRLPPAVASISPRST
jgi:hypothetical protein